MTISNHLELASEELAYNYMLYLNEEGEPLTLVGFQEHVRDNVRGLQEDGVRTSEDAYSLAYYLTLAENSVDIAANWEQVVADAEQIQRGDQE